MLENENLVEQSMADDQTNSSTKTNQDDISRLESGIQKEISKLKFYLDQTEELLTSNDYEEMAVVEKRTAKICDTLSELISNTVEMKIELDMTPRSVRQWRNEIKSSYAYLLQEKSKITEALSVRQKEIKRNEDERVFEAQTRQQERAEQQRQEARARQEEFDERVRQERLERERQMWQERLEAEITATEKRVEIENKAKATQAKLPKLRISPFDGTAKDWIRFENMFTTQVHDKPISDEERFGYLLEMVTPKVRARISNLKPSTSGYNTAWERLRRDYGHTNMVVNAHMDAIVNLEVVKGSSYEKVKEFYEKVSQSYDALETLGQAEMLKGFVLSTLNKLPQIKSDLVRTDDDWEKWTMKDLLENIQKWLRRNKVAEDSTKSGSNNTRKERQWYTQKGDGKLKEKKCLFCGGNHWADNCTSQDTREKRRAFFVACKLCFNCGAIGHRASDCKSRGCHKCQGRHHTSLCDRVKNQDVVLNAYTPADGRESLPAIIPVKVQGETLWAYLDTGSGRNFISSNAIRKLELKPVREEVRQIVTVNGAREQSLPMYNVEVKSVDGAQVEAVELTGSKMHNFTTIKRPNLSVLKDKLIHARHKQFYITKDNRYPIDLILGDSFYCKIKTEEVFKGKSDEPIVEGTTFGWVIHGGDYPVSECLFTTEVVDYEKLCSLDILGIEDRKENDQEEVLLEFTESITRDADGRYEVGIPWIEGSELKGTNREQCKRRLNNVERKLRLDEELSKGYDAVVKEQLEAKIIEKVPEKPTGDKVFYMPHKPVVRKDATTTKIRMVFDASAKPNPLSASINECMHTGPPLQPHLWDILIRARMHNNILLADIQKAFHQISIKENDRDAFRFLFNINGKQEEFRFTRVPFGAEASPFILGATLQHHYNQQPSEYEETVQILRDNTYVDNLMMTSDDVDGLEKFKAEATSVLNDGKFPLHKWESNVEEFDDEGMPNPGKILGLSWDKREDTLEISVPEFPTTKPVTKKIVLSHLGSIYDPLGLISPTLATGKHIYREICEEKQGWNDEVPPDLKSKWFRWTGQLRNVRIPRSITKACRRTKGIHIHQFADASKLACSTATIVIVESKTGTVKGLLTSKSRISKRNLSIARLELISGHMAANMAKNVCHALRHLPIISVTIWMDSLVALYWITNPERPWKVFVANRVRKIAETTKDIGVVWKYCPTEKNMADLGSRGASIERMNYAKWFTGPDWLDRKEEWPQQPELKKTPQINEEEKVQREIVSCVHEAENDEWSELLDRKSYWKTLRITAWSLRFVYNSLAKSKGVKKMCGPVTTQEIIEARNYWVRKTQSGISEDLAFTGFKLVKNGETGILKCEGRIVDYKPIYLENGNFITKLVQHVHEKNNHLGIAHTMASIREEWWIPHLRSRVKKCINNCNTCKVFSTKPYGATETATLPQFRTEISRPFEHTGIDFAGPLVYWISKKEEGKAYVLIFTCAASRAVHLELTKSQTAEEFQQKLNAFITRRTRPNKIISDNAATFRATATWIKKIRKDEKLNDFLASQSITWQFNLSKSPWWGGMYERLIKEIKKTLYKTLGKTHLNFEQLETVILDIERHLNNRPLTYVEAEFGEDRVLTPNIILWGQGSHTFDEDCEEESLSKFEKRLYHARQHAWTRWKKEYVHSLMESHRIRKERSEVPDVGEIVLIVGDEKNRGMWKKGKVIKHIKGRDGVIRGVSLLHKGHAIERPLQLVCPLEIRSESKQNQVEEKETVAKDNCNVRPLRASAKKARERIRLLAEEEY